MFYLAPSIPEWYKPKAREIGMGVMLTRRMGRHIQLAHDACAWGADNGCFTEADKFTLDGYLEWLERMRPARGNCLFATAPDVMADAEATLERSLPVFPLLRALGFNAALVSQDGLDKIARIPWEAFDAFFIGGSTEWKVSEASGRLCREAALRGKWCHMGRVNSIKRMRLAASFACQSVDGTHAKYDKHGLEHMRDWLAEINAATEVGAEEIELAS